MKAEGVVEVKERPYRTDIDGLRGVAVAAVILYHLSHALLPGGFVGVDVFFAISGFLITGNILHDLREGNFSLVTFYSSRVRRLFPAVAVCMLVTLLTAWLIMLPSDVMVVARSVTAGVLSGANFFFCFFVDTSYFAPAMDTHPLLHLWSLAVEEQFYFLFPLLLIWQSQHKYFPHALAVLACLSFASVHTVFARLQAVSFYMLLPRFGELLIGALLAIMGPTVAFQTNRLVHEVCGVIGLIVIFGAFFLFSEHISFPGASALLPCVGTAFVIFSSMTSISVVGRLLSFLPVVLLGKVSYSAYLYHWPIMAMLRYLNVSLSGIHGITVLVYTGFCATLSFLFVESPARKLQWRPSALFTVLFVIPALFLLALAVVSMHVEVMMILSTSSPVAINGSLPQANKNSSVLSRSFGADYDDTYVACSPATPTVCMPLSRGDCAQNCAVDVLKKRVRELLLCGDSHAAHYVPMFEEFALAGKFSFNNFALASTLPLSDPTGNINTAWQQILKQVQDVPTYHTIALAARWSAYYGQEPGFIQPNLKELLEKNVDRLLKLNKSVILIGEVPFTPSFREAGTGCPPFSPLNDPRRSDARYSQCFPLPTTVAWQLTRPFGFHRILQEIAAKRARVTYWDPFELMCPSGDCLPYMDGHRLYFDNSHLTYQGSRAIGRAIVAAFGVPLPILIALAS